MSKKAGSRKSHTRSRPSPNTKRSSASTRTSKTGRAKKALHRKLATELYAHTLSSQTSRPAEEAVVEGISMWPLLRPGYRIRFRRLPPDSLAPGDLIVVERTTRSGEAIVQVHRLIGRTGPLFLEAGDNTYSASLVTGDRIHGKVEAVWNGEGAAVPVPAWRLEQSRFRFFLSAASAFFFAHELKDRLLGRRRSWVLWKASRLYHRGLGAVGLRVPTLFPRA